MASKSIKQYLAIIIITGLVFCLPLLSLAEKSADTILATKSQRGEEGSLVALPYEPPGFTAYGIVFELSQTEIRNLPNYGDMH
jgi:hypothetical protein